MSWLRVFSYQLLKLGSTGSSKVFLYLALSVTSLLFFYQLVLNQDSLGSIISWEISPQISTTYNSNADYKEDDWAATTNDDNVQSKAIAVIQAEKTKHVDTHTPTPVPIPVYLPSPLSKHTPNEKELVVAAMKKSNMSWVDNHVSADWVVRIYRADVPKGEAELTVPENKGNEAMVYLTYLIDRYDSLPDIVVFIHSGRYQWHNDNPLYDSVISIKDLQLNHVRNTGYVNLRCVWTIGCPAELEPARYLRERPDDQGHPTAMEFPNSFLALFPGTEVPEFVGVQCCSQFAVSREAVVARGKGDYERMRKWLLESPLDAGTSGRIFEYSWHIMFGKPSQYCTDAVECYCNTYGYCNMTEADLERQWIFRGLTLPQGWPEIKQE
ncbi:Protein of unknown function DUF3431 [Penicillium sp. IBT 16267x]|nr:Protein of unknown function DUF3431 [Penicillium sp. IBT 16267x]